MTEIIYLEMIKGNLVELVPGGIQNDQQDHCAKVEMTLLSATNWQAGTGAARSFSKMNCLSLGTGSMLYCPPPTNFFVSVFVHLHQSHISL